MKKELINDIQILIDFADKHFTEDSAVDRAASRIAGYLNTYKLEENHD